jgi:pyruvate formate lyase activating enzyme
MNSTATTIFAVKRYALHDGPNIRTTIFFKGCPLSCQWCHNPEGIDFDIRVVSKLHGCIGCRACLSACPEAALELVEGGIRRDEKRCTACQDCIEVCPAVVHEATGRVVTTAELLAEIIKDQPFFEQSGGGVTFSGGEPLAQPEALLAILHSCAELGIHRVVDTCCYAATDKLLAVAALTDLFLVDLKHMDNARHKQHTGVGNELILRNLKTLAESGAAIRIRLPLVAGINDSQENITATAEFLAGCRGVQGVDLLPFHPSAKAKYRKLNQDFFGREMAAPSRERLAAISAILRPVVPDLTIGG